MVRSLSAFVLEHVSLWGAYRIDFRIFLAADWLGWLCRTKSARCFLSIVCKNFTASPQGELLGDSSWSVDQRQVEQLCSL